MAHVRESSVRRGAAPRPDTMAAMQPPTIRATATGARAGRARRVLDHPPSDRYAARRAAAVSRVPPGARPGHSRAALVGAAVIAFLGGPLSVTLGLVGVAAVIGWAVGSVRPAVARPRGRGSPSGRSRSASSESGCSRGSKAAS